MKTYIINIVNQDDLEEVKKKLAETEQALTQALEQQVRPEVILCSDAPAGDHAKVQRGRS